MKYLKVDNYGLKRNLKVASSALAKAIVDTYYPEVKNGVTLGANATEADVHWFGFIPKSTSSEVTPVILFRDPVERFRSACAEDGITPDEALNRPFTGHFEPQSSGLEDGTLLYQYENHLDDLLTLLGLSNLETVNEAGAKPDLTPEQLASVEEAYADDIALYESITEAGQVWTKASTPASDAQKSEKIMELNAARYAEECGGFTISNTGTVLDGVFIRSDRKDSQPKITQAALAANKNPDFTVDWQISDSEFVTLDASLTLTIAQAFLEHEQAGRSKLKGLIASVQSATTEDELNNIIW